MVGTEAMSIKIINNQYACSMLYIVRYLIVYLYLDVYFIARMYIVYIVSVMKCEKLNFN